MARNNISHASRCVLLVLASARSAMRLEDLQEAFLALARITTARYGATFAQDAFTSALRELEGSFIRIERKDKTSIVGFHNPSVLDFLESYLAENEQVLRDLCDSVVFYDQFKGLCLLRGDMPTHEHMAEIIGRDPELLRKGLVRTVEHPLQKMHIMKDMRGNTVVGVESAESIDANIEHAMRSLVHVGDDLASLTVNDLLTLARRRYAEHKASLQYAPDIVRAARKLNAAPALIDGFMGDAILILRESLREDACSEMYEVLCDIDEAFGEALPQDIRDVATASLVNDSEMIFDYDISSATDESELDDLKSRAQLIEGHLGVDLHKVVQRIDEQIEEVRLKMPDDPDDYSDTRSSEQADVSDNDIVDMFNTLRDR